MSAETCNAAGARAVVAEKLRRLGRAQSRLECLQTELDAELEGVRRRYDRRIAALRSRGGELRADLEAYCRERREAILPAGRKSLTTPHGEVGFRKGEAAVCLRDGLTEAQVCRLLRNAKLGELVRVTEHPDKLAVRRAFAAQEVTLEQVRRCGMDLVEAPPSFHCKLRHDALVQVGRN